MFGNPLYQIVVLLLALVIAVQLALRGVENSDFNLELRMSSSNKIAREQKREPEAEEVETDDEYRRDRGKQTRRWTLGLRLVGGQPEFSQRKLRSGEALLAASTAR